MTTQLLAADAGETYGQGAQDRFMIDASSTDGRFSLLQMVLDARRLAAPVHRHHAEDEYTYVLSGRIGVLLGTDELVAEAGDLIFMTREQWHTLWNAGDEPATVLMIVSPGGLERLFLELDQLPEFPEPDRLAEMAAEYNCDLDFDATWPIAERHGLVF